MSTKILIRPLNFHLRYQHWQGIEKSKDLDLLHKHYAAHVFDQIKNEIIFQVDGLSTKMQWSPHFTDSERLAYIIEHFKNILLKNKYILLKYEERNEVWDRGIKTNIQSFTFITDSKSNRWKEKTENNFGQIILEQSHGEKQSLLICTEPIKEEKHLSFEKLMEFLLTK